MSPSKSAHPAGVATSGTPFSATAGATDTLVRLGGVLPIVTALDAAAPLDCPSKAKILTDQTSPRAVAPAGTVSRPE